MAKTYVSTGENSTAGGAYSATSYVTVGAGAEINEPSLGGGDNTLPVAHNGPKGSVPINDSDQPNFEPDEQGFNLLFADDAEDDDLTFRLIPNSLGTFGNDVRDFRFNPATGEWRVFCNGVNTGHDSFQWVANDGQADSNVATQYFLCGI